MIKYFPDHAESKVKYLKVKKKTIQDIQELV